MGVGTWALVVLLLVMVVLSAWGLWLSQTRAQRHLPPPPPPPTDTWSESKSTPAALGPRSRASERVARESVFTQGVVLAVGMAHADGTVSDGEIEAIRSYITEHFSEFDEALAKKVVDGALAQAPGEAPTDHAIETIRAFASPDQRRAIIGMLQAVAHQDGELAQSEQALLDRVTDALEMTAMRL